MQTIQGSALNKVSVVANSKIRMATRTEVRFQIII
jgi:hypothetical protein